MIEHMKQDDQEYSSDSEPDEVLKETSKKEIKKLFEHEKQAQDTASKRLKSKRRDEIQRNIEQKRRKREQQSEIERLPLDLLNEVGINKNQKDIPIDEDDIDLVDSDQLDNNWIQRKIKKSAIVKSLTTPSTKFEVINLSQINSIRDQARTSKKSTCYNFRDEMLYGKKHNRRVKTWRVLANDTKRRVNIGR